MTPTPLLAAEANYLSYSEIARTLVENSKHAVLATLGKSGYPYTSVIEILPLQSGQIVTLLSSLAEHSSNLKQDPRVSIFLNESHDEPLKHPRVSLMGTLGLTDTNHSDAYILQHPQAELYVNFNDFQFYQFQPDFAYVIAGFGRMDWCDKVSYETAEPDPLFQIASGAIQHMNQDHKHNLVDYAKAFLKLDWVEDVEILNLDRYGFDLSIKGQEKSVKERLSFTKSLNSAQELRPIMADLAEEARAKLD